MGDFHGIDSQILDSQFHIFLHFPKQGWIDLAQIPHLLNFFQGSRCGIDRHFIFSRHDTQSRHMIHMFVGHQDAIQISSGESQTVQPGLRLFAADSHVHQQMRGL